MFLLTHRRCIYKACLISYGLFALLLLPSCRTTQKTSGGYTGPDHARNQFSIVRVSSYHATVTNLFLALGRGDIAGAMYYLSLLTGASISQQQAVINGLTNLFSEGNQQAGRCGDVARGGFQWLGRIGNHLGMRPYYLKIVSKDGVLLGFELQNGRTKQVADNGVHIALKFAGRVFDAFTGPGGLDETEYFRRLYTRAGQNVAYKEYASFPNLFQHLE